MMWITSNFAPCYIAGCCHLANFVACGLNQLQIHFVSLSSLVSIHLLIHLSTHLCHRQHSALSATITPSLWAENASHNSVLLVATCSGI